MELIKFLCLVTMTQNLYLKMDTLVYYIFINLFVEHAKQISQI